MALFSCEEKQRILQYVVNNFQDENLLNNDEKWMELAQEMNRDWLEIRDAYYKWRIEGKSSVKIENHEHVPVDATLTNLEAVELVEETTEEADQGVDEIHFANIDGELFNVIELHQQLLNNPEIINDMNFIDQQICLTNGKRELDLNDFNQQYLITLEKQSTEELNLRGEEHRKKMEIYNMQLEQGREIHKERMKILREKFRKLQDEVHHIDHVICNRNLRRRFKSGPI